MKPGKLRALIPAHPARPHWFKPLPEDIVISLDPAQWHKRRLLDPQIAQARLAEYFAGRNYVRCTVVASERAEALNAGLQDRVGDERGARLKRIFEVQLETPQGQKETRYVLAKSVGWGWLGYHAFLAGHRLAGFVPPILGLRDGILYMEWVPDCAPDVDNRATRIDAAASYIAARVRHLSLAPESAAGLDPPRQGNGARLLREQLGKAYGPFPINLLMQARLGRLLRKQPCPFPTFIDGNMQRGEWIDGPAGPLKADYEHHGLGKEELNVIDPAYDLADTILHLELSADEESRLIRRYVDATGDTGVEHRLMLNKLLAGLWTMKRAHDQLLGKTSLAERQQFFHRQFLGAWDFLTVQAARYCGRQRTSAAPRWRAPLVALDIDGVIDRRLFGFPTTTPAGVEALALLNAHCSVALDTARSIAEVKAYCEAYKLAGGVAEHGSYIWDAVNKRGRALISAEAASQIETLRAELARMPGVFLDERHLYSIRAFTYQDKPRSMTARLLKYLRSSSVGDGAVAPVPTLLVQHLIAELGLDRLSFHHTLIDTTIIREGSQQRQRPYGAARLGVERGGRDRRRRRSGARSVDVPRGHAKLCAGQYRPRARGAPARLQDRAPALSAWAARNRPRAHAQRGSHQKRGGCRQRYVHGCARRRRPFARRQSGARAARRHRPLASRASYLPNSLTAANASITPAPTSRRGPETACAERISARRTAPATASDRAPAAAPPRRWHAPPPPTSPR